MSMVKNYAANIVIFLSIPQNFPLKFVYLLALSKEVFLWIF